MKKNLTIEFFGFPGAGKTTVANNVIKRLNDIGIKTPTITYVKNRNNMLLNHKNIIIRIFYKLSLIIKYPRVSLKALLYVLSIRPTNKNSFKNIFSLLNTLYVINSLSKEQWDVVILDQGVAQNIWSIQLSGEEYDVGKMKKTIEIVAKNTKYSNVFFNARVNTALQRICERPTNESRLDVKPRSETERLLESNKNIFFVIRSYLEDVLKMNCLTINSDDEVMINTEEILNFIINHK